MSLIISVIAYRNYLKSHADMAAFNSRRANKLARRRLRKAAAAMKSDNSETFYDELLIALWGYLGDKLKMPTSELMRDNIKTVLETEGIPEDNISELLDILDRSEFAKYSPASGKAGMSELYDNAIEAINKLEKSFKAVK